MPNALRHGVTMLLVLMHALIGHAAGSAVCLGGGSCHRAEVVHLGIGHAHDHSGDPGSSDQGSSDHGHSHGHRHDRAGQGPDDAQGGGVVGRPASVVVDGAPDFELGFDAGCSAPTGACVDGWIPHGRAAGDPAGDDAAPMPMSLPPVAVVAGGVVRVRVERAEAQWPPGIDPSIGCTILVI
jgi:hypothetical protein